MLNALGLPFGRQHDVTEVWLRLHDRWDSAGHTFGDACRRDREAFAALFRVEMSTRITKVTTCDCSLIPEVSYDAAGADSNMFLFLPVTVNAQVHNLTDLLSSLLGQRRVGGGNLDHCFCGVPFAVYHTSRPSCAAPSALCIGFKRHGEDGVKCKLPVQLCQRLTFMGRTYTLRSMSLHLGERADQGHYLAWVRRNAGWSVYDDGRYYEFPDGVGHDLCSTAVAAVVYERDPALVSFCQEQALRSHLYSFLGVRDLKVQASREVVHI